MKSRRPPGAGEMKGVPASAVSRVVCGGRACQEAIQVSSPDSKDEAANPRHPRGRVPRRKKKGAAQLASDREKAGTDATFRFVWAPNTLWVPNKPKGGVCTNDPNPAPHVRDLTITYPIRAENPLFLEHLLIRHFSKT